MGQDGKGEPREASAVDPAQARRDRDAEHDRDVDRARRKLITSLVYAAPLVVSSVVVKPAHAQAASCAPLTCRPGGGSFCGPLGCPPRPACGPTSCSPGHF